MLQAGSWLKISDNSGAKKVRCLNSGKNKLSCGDFTAASVRKLRKNSKLKVGEVHYIKLLRTKTNVNRKSGSHVKFSRNEAILLTSQKLPRANRFFGPISRDLIKKSTKLGHISSYLI